MSVFIEILCDFCKTAIVEVEGYFAGKLGLHTVALIYCKPMLSNFIIFAIYNDFLSRFSVVEET